MARTEYDALLSPQMTYFRVSAHPPDLKEVHGLLGRVYRVLWHLLINLRYELLWRWRH